MTRVVIDIPDEDFTLLCEAFGEVELKSTLNLRLQSAVAHGTVLPEVEERPQGDIFTNEIVAGKCPIEAGGNCPLKSPSEWIAREDMDYIDENKVVHKHFECKECGLIHDFIDGHTSQYNFCPQCGARMQNGGAV